MVGTQSEWVHPKCAMAASERSASNFAITMLVAPAWMAADRNRLGAL